MSLIKVNDITAKFQRAKKLESLIGTDTHALVKPVTMDEYYRKTQFVQTMFGQDIEELLVKSTKIQVSSVLELYLSTIDSYEIKDDDIRTIIAINSHAINEDRAETRNCVWKSDEAYELDAEIGNETNSDEISEMNELYEIDIRNRKLIVSFCNGLLIDKFFTEDNNGNYYIDADVSNLLDAGLIPKSFIKLMCGMKVKEEPIDIDGITRCCDDDCATYYKRGKNSITILGICSLNFTDSNNFSLWLNQRQRTTENNSNMMVCTSHGNDIAFKNISTILEKQKTLKKGGNPNE